MGSPMVVTLGRQQYNVGERPTVILCMVTYYYIVRVKDQPGKVTNPARDQMNKENEYCLVRVRA